MTHEIKPPTAAKMAVRTAVILFLFVVTFTGLLSGAYLWTLPTIEAAASEEKMKLINEVLPADNYDNDLLKDAFQIAATPALGQDGASTEWQLGFRAAPQGPPQDRALQRPGSSRLHPREKAQGRRRRDQPRR